MTIAPPPAVALQFGAIAKFTIQRDGRRERLGTNSYPDALNIYLNNWLALQGIDLSESPQPVELIQQNDADTFTLIAKTGADANVK